MSAFDACLAFTLREEGGAVNNPRDPGGFTYRGITLATFRSWTGNSDASSSDLLAVADDDLAAIYGGLYWNPINGEALPPSVAMMVFDFGVNTGPRRSALTLQEAVGTAQDGSIGPMTLAAAKAADPKALVAHLAELRGAFYRGLPTFSTFGCGWWARTDRCEAAAMALLPSVLPTPINPGV